MTYSKKQLYAMGEPFGDSVTRKHAGRIIYGGGGSGGGGTSTTTQNIPDELKPLATAYTQKAMGLSDTYNPYQGQRFEDLNAIQGAGLGMATDRALSGSATMDNAEGRLNQMIGGQGNPYLDAMYDQAAGKVSNSVNSNFANAGRYGSGAHTGALTEGLGNMATNLYGGAYENDMGRSMQAIGMAPTFGNAAYQDASQLLNAGQIIQDQGQQQKDFDYTQFQEAENMPYKNLAAMSGVFGSNLGGSSTTKQSSGGGK